jgi:short-subunit dehydrogenase
MSSTDFAQARSIVTGASSGIGRALAVELARRKGRIALVGRRADVLEQVRDECMAAGASQAEIRPFDLADTVAIGGLVADIESRLGGAPELTIHAAGQVLIASVEDYPLADAAKLMNVNLMAGYALAKALVPRLRAKGGTIGFLSSGTAYRAMPYQWAYSASKAGIERLAEALRVELADTPVRIRVVSPGPVDTAMNSNPPSVGGAPMLSSAKTAPAPSQIAPAILAGFSSRLPRTELASRVRLVRWLSAFGAQPLDALLSRKR